MSDRLAQLAALAELVREQELARLSEMSRKRREIETRLKDCRDAQRRTLSQAAPDPAHIAGADVTWLRWNAEKLYRLTQQASMAAADAEDQIVAARRAFGRAEALSALATRAQRRKAR